MSVLIHFAINMLKILFEMMGIGSLIFFGILLAMYWIGLDLSGSVDGTFLIFTLSN